MKKRLIASFFWRAARGGERPSFGILHNYEYFFIDILCKMTNPNVPKLPGRRLII
jgi:hypothetical protein